MDIVTDQIFIRDLLVKGILGILPNERETPQDILINLILYTDTQLAGQTDDLRLSVNYAEVAEAARQCAESARRFTVEALAADLAALCLSFPGVRTVRVRLEKPHALPAARSAGIEIVRSQPESG